MNRNTNTVPFICLLFLFMSCTKEYSFERKPDLIFVTDTITKVNNIPTCLLCIGANNTVMKKWSFKQKNSIQCGEIDTAIITPNRNAFTFFGPSSCSSDTGLVITAYLDPIKLDKDVFNFTTNHVAFYYYDHVKPSYIFMVRPPLSFSLTIESYIHQTGIIKGSFSGSAFKDDNSLGLLESGKFSLQLY
jgi:hypothetical protein